MTKLVVLALSILLGVGLLIWGVWQRGCYRGGEVELIQPSLGLRELLDSRRRDDVPPDPPFGAPGFPPPFTRPEISESEARLLFPQIGHRCEYDARLFYRRPPHEDLMRPLEEHPKGGFPIITNSLGMRMDTEPAAAKPDLRVLVTGASNVEGVCANSESASARLARRLERRREHASVEVINTACGAYSFFHYVAVLERYLELDPDVFVVVAYGGNDFFGCVRLWRFTHGRGTGANPISLEPLRGSEDRFFDTLLGTELGQAAYFTRNPDDVEVAITAACSATAEMHRICDERGIRFVCAFLPTPLTGQPRHFPDLRARIQTRVALAPEALDASDRIADRWLDFLAARGIPFRDLRPAFRAAQQRLFWESDSHINLAGQELLAVELLSLVAPS